MSTDPEDTPLRLQKLASFFVPPDLEDALKVGSTPEERASAQRSFRRRMLRWRVCVSAALIGMLTVAAWDHGVPGHFFPSVGVGLAYADTTERKIADSEQRTRIQVATVLQKQADTDHKLDEHERLLKQIQADSFDKKLKDLQTEICKTSDPGLKRRLNELLEDGMREYRRIAGEDYRVRSCEVL